MTNTVSEILPDDTLNRIIQIESAGNPNAKAPTSSAAGLGQFISATWIATVKKHRPDLIAGGSVPSRVGTGTAALQVEMLARFTEDNARALGAGYADGDLYLAHFLGLGDARKLFRAAPSTPAASVVTAAAVNANRSILAGKTCGQVRAWAQNAMITRWAQAGRPDWVAKFAGGPVVLPPPKPPVSSKATPSPKAPSGGEATAGGAVVVAGGTAAAAASEGWGWMEWSIAAVVLIAACAALFYGWRWWKARKAHAELGARDLDRMDDEARQTAIDAAGTAAVSHALNQPEGSPSWNSTGDQSQVLSLPSRPKSEPSLAPLSADLLAAELALSAVKSSPATSAPKRRRTRSAKPSPKTSARPKSSRSRTRKKVIVTSRGRKSKSKG